MDNKFKYDAFISYRHTELDKFVAENLHKQLEAFRLPKSAVKKHKSGKTRIERVFRDKDELPLTSNLEDPIIQALQNSEWLIVICSPRLRESLWCRKEIETFVALRGREHVLAVLIEGEPSESFPDELLYKIEKRTLPGGAVEEVKLPVEPLAADVRGKTKKDMLKAMKTEILRLLATMFGVEYDDLRQRHRERKMRRIVTASLLGGAACLLFGVFSTATALRIQKQNEQIAAQSAEIQAQSDEIQKQSAEIQAQNEELALKQAQSLVELASHAYDEGDRVGAIQTVVEALTESDGIDLPYTPEAQYILAESLGVYNIGNTYKANYQFETMGIIKNIAVSKDNTMLGIYDDTGVLTIFDMVDREIIYQLSPSEAAINGERGYYFLTDNRLAYINSNFAVAILDLEKKEIQERLLTDHGFSIYGDNAGNYFIVEDLYNNMNVYDGHTLEWLGQLPISVDAKDKDKTYLHKNGVLACVSQNTICFIDLKTQEIISSVLLNGLSVDSIAMNEKQAFVIVHYPEDHLKQHKTQIMNINIASGELLWQTENERYYGEKLILPVAADSKHMLLVTNQTLSLINMENGEFGAVSYPDSEVVQAYPVTSSNRYYLFCENGAWITVDPNSEFALNYSYMFDCRSSNNQNIHVCNGNIVVLPTNDNRITVYSATTGPDVKESSHTVVKTESNRISGDEVAELARSYGLEDPDFVKSGFYSDDNRYFFANYWNGTLLIYDTESKENIILHENFYDAYVYLGADHNGYHYITGYGGGYVLNEDMKFLAHIPDLVDMDKENDKVYMQSGSIVYEAPLYTADELIAIANQSFM